MSSRTRWSGGAIGFVIVLVIGYFLAAVLIPRGEPADSDEPLATLTVSTTMTLSQP